MKAKTMTELILEYHAEMQALIDYLGAEHERKVQELTQRIGERDARIERLTELLRQLDTVE